MFTGVSGRRLSTASFVSCMCSVYFCMTKNKCVLACTARHVCFHCAWVHTMRLLPRFIQSKHHAEHKLLSQGNSLGSHQTVLDIKAMRKAISAGFSLTDQQVSAQAEQHHWVDGAVCAAAWIVDKTAFVANVGLQT